MCGVDFTHYKRSTVVRRIERRMVVTHSATLSDFASLLEIDEREAKALGREILIGVTRFFRDEESFQKLKYKAIYDILARTSERETIRVWVAGCSTGEEAYSVAILFREAMDEQNIRRQVKIFATDVDMQSVEIASKGIYPESIVDDVSADRLMRFFEIRGESYHIVNEIRKMIVFAPHNLFTDPPFGKLDLISCRNVMIYFQPVLQKTLFGIFHSALKDGGYLFLGKSESANDLTNFLSSTMIGILFLDDNLNIRKFTEYVGREFNIMAHDVGRSIQIVAHLFQDIDIVEDAEAVLRSLMPIDKEVTTVDGKNYTLRIAPYRTTENSIEGLVLTIIDSIGEK